MNAKRKEKPKWTCFLCNSSRGTTGQYITLHKFPVCSETRKSWLIKCNLKESDNVSNIRICSKHFVERDYRNPEAHAYGGLLKLKAGVIPSIALPSQRMSQHDTIEVQPTSQSVVEKEGNNYVAKSFENMESVISQITENETTLVLEEVEHNQKQKNLMSDPKYIEVVPTSDVLTAGTLTANIESDDLHSTENDDASDEVEYNRKWRNLSISKCTEVVLTSDVSTSGTSTMNIESDDLHSTDNDNTSGEVEDNRKRKNLSDPKYIEDILSSDVLPPRTPTMNIESDDSHSIENDNVLDNHGHTPKRKRFSEPRYIGDLKSTDVLTPRTAKRMLNFAANTIKIQKRKIHALREKNKRLLGKIRNFKEMVTHLRDKKLVSPEAEDTLMDCVPEYVKELITRKVRKKTKYSAELRVFALTLQFYSPKAYEYIRKTWRYLLPHSSTLRSWYSQIDGKPGFTKESFDTLRQYAISKPVIVNIVMDEMSIREQIIFENNRFYGGVDLGTGISLQSDNGTMAHYALVIMAVGINASWKIPLGYFLIKNLNGKERANLLKICLQLLHDVNVKVHSLTFDGAASNLSMATALGANFTYDNNFKPWFLHPVTKTKIYVFLDACHMLKLARNVLGDKGVLRDKDDGVIQWKYLESLEELQRESGLRAANKLTKKHLQYNNNPMKVKLAAQTLSNSVYNALRLCDQIKLKDFEGCMPTAHYCEKMDMVFDILNCRNRFSKRKYNVPICAETIDFLKNTVETLITYLANIKDNTGRYILSTNRKTAFLGFIINLQNVFALYNDLKDYMSYLLSFKLSQDFLETFFSSIRSRNGFNNNPNAKQFESAYKRLLVRHEISNFCNSNCLADGIDILHVSSKRIKNHDDILEVTDDDTDLFPHIDHDYTSTLWKLTPYIENIVEYIAGYVVKGILKMNICSVCEGLIISPQDEVLFIKLKNRGSLLNPSTDVRKICMVAETCIRENIHRLFVKSNMKRYLTTVIFSRIEDVFNSAAMEIHIKNQDILQNHRTQLCKLIIEFYLKIRLHHEARLKSNEKDSFIRQKYTKLILFKNQ